MIPVFYPRSFATSPGRATSPLALQKPCQSKKRSNLNAVAVSPGSEQQVIGTTRQQTTRQFLPVWRLPVRDR
jgi:hypothetical protein